MLNEEAAPPLISQPSSPPIRQNPLPLSAPPIRQNPLPPSSRALRVQSFSLTRSRVFVSLGVAVALFCIAAVLLILFRREAAPTSHATQARTIVSPATVPLPAPVQASAAPVSAPASAQEPPQQQEPSSEPVQFHLKRAKAFEKVGPIRLRLVKANARRNTCDLYINSGGPSYQKQARLNKPVPIDLANDAGSAELVVTSIKSDQISGSLQPKQ